MLVREAGLGVVCCADQIFSLPLGIEAEGSFGSSRPLSHLQLGDAKGHLA